MDDKTITNHTSNPESKDISSQDSFTNLSNKSFPFGIYIHWPFCLSKCPYCDFFSQVKKDVPQAEIIKEYIEDLDFYHQFSDSKEVTSVFFGGGTPSLIEPQNIEKIINHICKKWNVSHNVEVSLEANPNTQKPELFQNLKKSGINRLSLGIQALNDSDLKFLGRTHNREEALQAINSVIKNFDNHSIDLIYARPNQTLEQWKNELEEALSFGTKHLSLYQLTIEEGTLFYKKQIKSLNEEGAAEMYDFTKDFLQTYGYEKYEVSNFAQNGFASRHNLLYWQGDDYLGIGKSAHGRLCSHNKIYATTHKRQMEMLTAEERAVELLLMGLRISAGIDKKHFQEKCGLNFDTFINQKKIAEFEELNLIKNTSDNLKATAKGFLVLDKIIEELL